MNVQGTKNGKTVFLAGDFQGIDEARLHLERQNISTAGMQWWTEEDDGPAPDWVDNLIWKK